jgi:hypothetical protein
MADARTRHLRRLRRLGNSARRWSVLAGLLGGASLVLVPYRGLGWPDAIWTALFGGSAALAAWRWSDRRELAALPVPEAEPVGYWGPLHHVGAAMSRFPAGQGALAELRRMQSRTRVRGSAVAPAFQRLDHASRTMAGLAGRLSPAASSVLLDATAAERALRDLGERTAAVHRAARLAPADTRLAAAHDALVAQFTEGVDAYEQLVAAAAGCVAEDGRTNADATALGRLREATDLLRGMADGFAEFRPA